MHRRCRCTAGGVVVLFYQAMRNLLENIMLLSVQMMLIILMAIREAEADMGATRIVRFEKKADSIYRAVRTRRQHK